jgi:hypothetical protein
MNKWWRIKSRLEPGIKSGFGFLGMKSSLHLFNGALNPVLGEISFHTKK